ncbi:dienelactone hydrolase [Alkalihalobacillus xiaoxiensis]|uniref:Dienelactone hydrolase n=1 Tax=Shouchella xiaoxiensis TaxID=766895 RepID=A0ABS2SW59_9BACI|nr:acyl-CoA thioesterase/bile acid-CoA:amino acid N-acyltransferase family protein [Shouchella xiaoxiensis]MBM7839779.1 dienelactone hydrolase [Shouchella xiaoxiensis]
MNQKGEPIHFHVQAESDSILEKWSVKIQTEKPLEEFKVVVTTKDDLHKPFQSCAFFRSDKDGVIDLTADEPVKGDYDQSSEMSFISSMSWNRKKEAMFVKQTPEPITYEIEVYYQNKVVGRTAVSRTIQPDNVVKEEVGNGLVGAVFHPDYGDSFPAVVIVGGSDGAVHEAAAAALAAEGFVVMALAYFGKEGLPKGVEQVPLEYVDRAFTYLSHMPNVEQDKLGIIGHSRGSELALLYASHFPKVKSVIAAAPSEVVFSGMVNFQPVAKSAWTLNDKPVPYYDIKQRAKDGFSMLYHMVARKPYSNLAGMEMNLADEEKLKQFAIPVEQIQAPIMVFAGTDDQSHLSVFFSNRLEQRRAQQQEDDRFIYHEGAGHFSAFPSNLPNMPQTTGMYNYGMTMLFGGTKETNARTAQQSWDETLEFLRETLM